MPSNQHDEQAPNARDISQAVREEAIERPSARETNTGKGSG